MVAFDKEEFIFVSEFRNAIERTRESIKHIKIIEETSYKYAIFRAFCRMIVTCCEVYTLLQNGYPDGAMALSRQIYESLIITDVLRKGYQKKDLNMLNKFFDALCVTALKMDKLNLSCILENNSNDEEAKKQLQFIECELLRYKNIYSVEQSKDFSDYWWAGCKTFSDLVRMSDYPKYYIYMTLSNRVHMNVFSILFPVDHGEDGVLLGDSIHGKDEPVYYSSLFMSCAAEMISHIFSDICSPMIVNMFKKCTDLAGSYKCA